MKHIRITTTVNDRKDQQIKDYFNTNAPFRVRHICVIKIV